MARKVFILNGPILNALGKRTPGIQGNTSLKDIESACQSIAESRYFAGDFRQTNHESVLIDWLFEAGDCAMGVALNPGAHGRTSITLNDAMRAIQIPVVELHISNIHAREEFRHKPMISSTADGVTCGFGANTYNLALHALPEICDK